MTRNEAKMLGFVYDKVSKGWVDPKYDDIVWKLSELPSLKTYVEHEIKNAEEFGYSRCQRDMKKILGFTE